MRHLSRQQQREAKRFQAKASLSSSASPFSPLPATARDATETLHPDPLIDKVLRLRAARPELTAAIESFLDSLLERLHLDEKRGRST